MTEENKKDYGSILLIGLVIVIIGIVGFNALQMSQFSKANVNNQITGNVVSEVKQNTVPGIDVTPKGTPEIYGKELGVSYDDVSSSNPQKADSTIARIGQLDTSINLQGDDLKRYISIVSKISCEYCCGTESIIFSNGQASCGCAHSFAMRGLAKYLIKNHATEYTDDEILEELGKWKTLFFPDAISKKAQVLQDKGIELNYINLASNKYRGIEN